MSSTSGVYGNSGQANYGAAKDGIAGLTRVVVARPRQATASRSTPSAPARATRMTQTVPDERPRRARQKRGVAGPGGQAHRIRSSTPGPENVAPFVVYLATDAASHINGQIFFVMGGLISLLNYPAPVRTIQTDGRWTPEEIATLFPRTLGHGPGEPGAGAATAPERWRRAGTVRPRRPRRRELSLGRERLGLLVGRRSTRSLPRGWPPSGRAGCAP